MQAEERVDGRPGPALALVLAGGRTVSRPWLARMRPSSGLVVAAAMAARLIASDLGPSSSASTLLPKRTTSAPASPPSSWPASAAPSSSFTARASLATSCSKSPALSPNHEYRVSLEVWASSATRCMEVPS